MKSHAQCPSCWQASLPLHSQAAAHRSPPRTASETPGSTVNRCSKATGRRHGCDAVGVPSRRRTVREPHGGGAQPLSSRELNTLIAAARKAADGVSPALAAPAKASLETNMADIQAASVKNDRTGVALASVEGYRTLVESATDTGRMPIAVSLLDYAGFRYQADLTAKPVRWDDMNTAVAFAEQKWSGIANRITDTALKADFAKSITDMSVAAKAKNAKAAKTASTQRTRSGRQARGILLEVRPANPLSSPGGEP